MNLKDYKGIICLNLAIILISTIVYGCYSVINSKKEVGSVDYSINHELVVENAYFTLNATSLLGLELKVGESVSYSVDSTGQELYLFPEETGLYYINTKANYTVTSSDLQPTITSNDLIVTSNDLVYYVSAGNLLVFLDEKKSVPTDEQQIGEERWTGSSIYVHLEEGQQYILTHSPQSGNISNNYTTTCAYIPSEDLEIQESLREFSSHGYLAYTPDETDFYGLLTDVGTSLISTNLSPYGVAEKARLEQDTTYYLRGNGKLSIESHTAEKLALNSASITPIKVDGLPFEGDAQFYEFQVFETGYYQFHLEYTHENTFSPVTGKFVSMQLVNDITDINEGLNLSDFSIAGYYNGELFRKNYPTSMDSGSSTVLGVGRSFLEADETYYLAVRSNDIYKEGTLSLLATKEAAIAPVYYKISFDSNGGTCSTDDLYTGIDGTLSIIPTASRSGYHFNGWHTASTGGEKITTSTVFTQNATVFAQWSKETSSGGTGNGSGSTGGVTGNTGSSTENTAKKYKNDILLNEFGDVTVSPLEAELDEKIVITVVPQEGYEVETVLLTNVTTGEEVSVTLELDGTYSFIQPESVVEIQIIYKKLPLKQSFIDVETTEWYYESVEFVYEKGLMFGVGNGRFAPAEETLRCMMITILHSLDGNKTATQNIFFKDVNSTDYFAKAVAWGKENRIITGISADSFAPYRSITREELVAMLYSYSKHQNHATDGETQGDGSNRSTSFIDEAKINSWAEEAVAWCAEMGIVAGKPDGSFDPQGPANRAEIAQILKNYIQLYY